MQFILKFAVSLFAGSLVYLAMSPTWNLTIGSFLFVGLIFVFLSSLIGLPTCLVINQWLKKDSLACFAVKTLVCVELSFLLPWAMVRWFQLTMAKMSNLTQMGHMAMFSNGRLSENGKAILMVDFNALFVAGLVVVLIAFVVTFCIKPPRVAEG